MRRRHRKQTSEVDLNITPFLNLMIVLVPVLLLSMVFTQTRIMELSFPESDGAPPSRIRKSCLSMWCCAMGPSKWGQ